MVPSFLLVKKFNQSMESQNPQSYYTPLDVVHDTNPQTSPTRSLLQSQNDQSSNFKRGGTQSLSYENLVDINNEPFDPTIQNEPYSAHYHTKSVGYWSPGRILSIVLAILAVLATFVILFNIISSIYELIYFGVMGTQAALIPYTILFLFMLMFACCLTCLGIGAPIAHHFNRTSLAFDFASTFTAGFVWFVVCINFLNLVLGITMTAAFGASMIGWVLATLFVNSFCFCGCIAFGSVTSYAMWNEIPDRLDGKRGVGTVHVFQIVFYLVLGLFCCCIALFFLISLVLSIAVIVAQKR
jgi:hypothetical protein